MTGDLEYISSKKEIHKHTRAIFAFTNDYDLRFKDMRKLGKMYVVPDADFRRLKGLDKMGPEPLEKGFTLKKFKEILKERTGRIKALLLDQYFIAGIGNVYGDEILFHARIHPEKEANKLTRAEIKKLYKEIRHVLGIACKMKAMPHVLPEWLIGVRGPKGICPRCEKKFDRVHIQGRYSYFCLKCQKY